ncbi:hypothetical protein [Xanthomonas phage BUDD]|nr:hypothetical protein [Xanthomonas phage BUDD]
MSKNDELMQDLYEQVKPLKKEFADLKNALDKKRYEIASLINTLEFEPIADEDEEAYESLVDNIDSFMGSLDLTWTGGRYFEWGDKDWNPGEEIHYWEPSNCY